MVWDMTIHDLYAVARAPRPARSGQPWTDEDYATLVRLTGDGLDAEAIAGQLQRPVGSVMERARRMLPLEERSVYVDHALSRLRTHLLADAAYDWSAALARATPRPAPTSWRPTPTGIEALDNEDLVAIAEALALSPRLGDETLRERIARAVAHRGLAGQVCRGLENHVQDQVILLLRPYDDAYVHYGYGYHSDQPWS